MRTELAHPNRHYLVIEVEGAEVTISVRIPKRMLWTVVSLVATMLAFYRAPFWRVP